MSESTITEPIKRVAELDSTISTKQPKGDYLTDNDYAFTKELKDVIKQENEYIKQRRQTTLQQLPKEQQKSTLPAQGQGAATTHNISPDKKQHCSGDNNIIGLALSGGGMRSATFNLGVIQGLAKTELLPWVDYLSTVSGGGYLGCCLSSLLSMRTITLSADTEVWPEPVHNHSTEKWLYKLPKNTEVEIVGKAWLFIDYKPKQAPPECSDPLECSGPPETEMLRGWIAEDIQKNMSFKDDRQANEPQAGPQQAYYVWSYPSIAQLFRERKSETQPNEVRYLPNGFKFVKIKERWLNIRYKLQPDPTDFSEGWILLPKSVPPPEYKFNTSSNFPFDPNRPAFSPQPETLSDQAKPNHQLYHLRLNGNFISPRRGPFNAGTLRGIGTILTGLSHTLGIFMLLFFIIAGLHYVLAGTLAPEIGQKIHLIQPTPPAEADNDPGTRVVGVAQESDAIDPALNVQATRPVTSPTSQAFDRQAHTLPFTQIGYVLFFSEPPTVIDNGQLITTVPAPILPDVFWRFLGTGLILPFFFFWYLQPACRRLQTIIRSEKNVSEEERMTRHIMQTGILALILTFTIVTLVSKFWLHKESTFNLYWLWQPTVFMVGVWFSSTFIYMLYAQHRLWSPDFRSLISVWQGVTIYGLMGSLLFAVLALPYYLTLPSARGEGSNAVILLGTSLLSTLASYLLANNLAKTGSTGWLNKFFSRLERLQQGVLAVLVIILVLSITLLFATVFDSIPSNSSQLTKPAWFWTARLFIIMHK